MDVPRLGLGLCLEMLWKDSRAVSEAGRMEKNEAPSWVGGAGQCGRDVSLAERLDAAGVGIPWDQGGYFHTMELCQLAFVLSEWQPCTYGCLGLISPRKAYFKNS